MFIFRDLSRCMFAVVMSASLVLLFIFPFTAQTDVELDADSDGAVDMSKGGLGIVLADPGVDRLIFWDDSATDMGWLTVGAGLTVTNTTLTADAPVLMENVVVEDPADADAFILFKAPEAITISDIHCIADGGTSVVIDVQECSGTGTGCATVDATITCDTDGAEDDGTLSNGAIDSGDWVKLDIGTVTGAVDAVTVSIYR